MPPNDEKELQKEWRKIVIDKLDALDKDIKNINNQMVNNMASDKDIADLKVKIAETETKLVTSYVSKAEFEPIKKAMYGLAAVIGSAIVVALLKTILFS